MMGLWICELQVFLLVTNGYQPHCANQGMSAASTKSNLYQVPLQWGEYRR